MFSGENLFKNSDHNMINSPQKKANLYQINKHNPDNNVNIDSIQSNSKLDAADIKCDLESIDSPKVKKEEK